MLTIAPPLLEWFLHLSFLHQSLSPNKCEFRVAAEFVNCAAADWGLPLFANSTAAGTRRQLTPERQRLPRQQPNSEGNAESSPCSRMIKPKDFYAAKMFFEFFKSCGSCESCIGPPAGSSGPPSAPEKTNTDKLTRSSLVQLIRFSLIKYFVSMHNFAFTLHWKLQQTILKFGPLFEAILNVWGQIKHCCQVLWEWWPQHRLTGRSLQNCLRSSRPIS